MAGKGIIDKNGDVHTFDSDEYELHSDYLAEHPSVWPSAMFYIDPDGAIDVTFPNKHYGEHAEHAQALDRILEVDPHFHEDLRSWDW
jgi:hypothetical protein